MRAVEILAGGNSGGGNSGGFAGGTGPGSGVGNSGGSNSRIWRVPPGASTNPEAGNPGRWANATSGIRVGRSSRTAAGPGSMSVETGLMTLQEDELQGILQVLAQIARTGEGTKDKLDPNAFQSRLSTLPRRARFTISQALSALAAQAPTESSDRPTLLKLAEHIAIRFALESYETRRHRSELRAPVARRDEHGTRRPAQIMACMKKRCRAPESKCNPTWSCWPNDSGPR